MTKDDLFQKLEKLTRKQKILIILFTLILFCGGYWYFFYNPTAKKIEGLEKDISELNQQIRNYRAKAAKLPKLLKKLKSQEEVFIWAKTLLPESSSEVEKLLSQIEKLGKDIGVEFLHFAPGSERLHEFYATRQVTLKLSGTFHNLMYFFSHLSRLSRLVSLQSLNLNPSSRESDFVNLAADMKILVYRALTEQEIEARKKKKKK